MQWSNVKLIFSREMRDQMRDRRTLFTVAVLPLILYPHRHLDRRRRESAGIPCVGG